MRSKFFFPRIFSAWNRQNLEKTYKTIVFKKLDFRQWRKIISRDKEQFRWIQLIVPSYSFETVSDYIVNKGFPSEGWAENVGRTGKMEFAEQPPGKKEDALRKKYRDLQRIILEYSTEY